jgi:hypothetical protein
MQKSINFNTDDNTALYTDHNTEAVFVKILITRILCYHVSKQWLNWISLMHLQVSKLFSPFLVNK